MRANVTTFSTAAGNTQQFRQQVSFRTSVTILVAQITTGIIIVIIHCVPGSSVGAVTCYGLDGPGIESRWR